MTKQELHDKVQEVCVEMNASNKLKDALSDLLAPKAGGTSLNIDEVTRKDAAGNISELQCSLSGYFYPATLDNFYEDKSGTSRIVTKEGVKLNRQSKQALAIRKAHTKSVADAKNAIIADMFSDEPTVSQEEAKAKIIALEKSSPVFPEPELV